MKEEEKILAGILFEPGAEELRNIKRRTHKLNQDYNRLYEDQTKEREEILGQILGACGNGTFLQGPITFHYGIHTRIGDHTFINFNFTVQDDAQVVIGDHCDFGPNVTIVTPVHPMLPNERRALLSADGTKKHLCYAKPVHIGNNCWLGANVVICPGVTIGNNCVIGAGSVVVKSMPENTFCAGNPCKVIREITDRDSMVNYPQILGEYQMLAELE